MDRERAPTEAQIEWFWEYFGLKYCPLPITRGNLFDYAVPELLKKHTLEITLTEKGVRVCIYFDFDEGKNMIINAGSDLTLVLFWSITEVIPK